MLPASVWAPGYADPRAILNIDPIGEILVQLSSTVLCFGNRQLAELNAGAGNQAAPCPRRLVVDTRRLEVVLHCLQVLAVDVQQNDVLRIGRAKPAAPVFFGELGQYPQLLAGRPTADQRDSYIVK